MRGVCFGYQISSMSFQFEKYPNQSGIPTFRCSLIYCVISVCVSSLRKIYFNAYAPRQISTKNQFLNKPGFPLSALIILDWYPYVSLFPDFFKQYRFECQRFTQNTFQRLYIPSNFHTKSVPKQTRIPIVLIDSFRLG